MKVIYLVRTETGYDKRQAQELLLFSIINLSGPMRTLILSVRKLLNYLFSFVKRNLLKTKQHPTNILESNTEKDQNQVYKFGKVALIPLLSAQRNTA